MTRQMCVKTAAETYSVSMVSELTKKMSRLRDASRSAEGGRTKGQRGRASAGCR